MKAMISKYRIFFFILAATAATCSLANNAIEGKSRRLGAPAGNDDNGNSNSPSDVTATTEEESIDVLIGYKNDNGKSMIHGKAKKLKGDLTKIKVIGATIGKSKFQDFQDELDKGSALSSIDFIELDAPLNFTAEDVPWGIPDVQGNSTVVKNLLPPSSVIATNGNCSDPGSFKIAIIDTGLLTTHPDVPCNVTKNNCIGATFIPSEFVASSPWNQPSMYHGTHVFGTVAAVGGNGIGVTSMVPNASGICFLTARVDVRGVPASAFYLYGAMDWAVSQGAKVISLSLTGGYTYTGQLAVQQAHAAGAIIVAAAGNDGRSVLGYPASYEDVLSVAAVDATNTVAWFSTFNNMTDIAAPGVGVLSLHLTGGVRYASGTSMATPHVAGAVTQIWKACPACTNTDVEVCLLNTTMDRGAPGRDDYYGHGVLQTEAAYQCLLAGCCAPRPLGCNVTDETCQTSADCCSGYTCINDRSAKTCQPIVPCSRGNSVTCNADNVAQNGANAKTNAGGKRLR